MRGDFSRLTFDPAAGFTQVLFQQGQDLVDSEFNEQAAVLRHQIRATGEFATWVQRHDGARTFTAAVAKAVVPPAPPAPETVTLTASLGGWVFVPGFGRVVLDPGARHPQPYPFPGLGTGQKFLALVLETTDEPVRPDADPAARLADPALAGGSAALRLRPVHRLLGIPHDTRPASPPSPAEAGPLLGTAARPGTGRLRPVLGSGEPADPADECAPLAEDRFQGVENQLYRVEVHAVRPDDALEVKVSRDNAAVAYRVESIENDSVAGAPKLKVPVAAGWADDWWAVRAGGTVELVPAAVPGPAAAAAPADPRPLLAVEQVEPEADGVVLTLTGWDKDQVDAARGTDFPLLVRWDHDPDPGHKAGGRVVRLGAASATARLEDDLSVEFQGPAADFRPGDFWLIPVRAATGEALWPREPGDQAAGRPAYDFRPPHGPRPTYTPLALVDLSVDDPRAEPYPWDQDDLAGAADLQPTVVAGAPAAGARLGVKIPEAETAVALADKLDPVRVPVRFVFTARQLLVFHLGAKPEPVGPLGAQRPTAEQLDDAARRLSFDPKALPELIAQRVKPLVEPEGRKTFTGSPAESLKKLEVDSLKALAAPVKAGLLTAFQTIEALAASPSLEDVKAKTKAAGAPGGQVDADTAKLQTAWHDAQRVRFFLLAWPYATITPADWPA
jgi:hypothetical protein